MAAEWDPIDPDDIVDLFVDFGGPSGNRFFPCWRIRRAHGHRSF